MLTNTHETMTDSVTNQSVSSPKRESAVKKRPEALFLRRSWISVSAWEEEEEEEKEEKGESRDNARERDFWREAATSVGLKTVDERGRRRSRKSRKSRKRKSVAR
jgi:hypothetical protein